jgi:hypothetical protein
MSDKYFVVAGHRYEFDVFVNKKCHTFYSHGLVKEPSQFIFVSDVTKLKGHYNPCGWFVGTWRERKDIKDILYQLIFCKSAHKRTREFNDVCKEFGFSNFL